MLNQIDDSAAIAAETTEIYTIVRGAMDHGLLLVCEHAGNALPPGYGTLGIAESELERHIAYDIGVAGVVRSLADQLGVPALLSHYSRLLIDLNRATDDPTLVMRLSDGAIVPGNRNIDQTEIAHRVENFYRPYHRAFDGLLDRYMAAGITPVIVSIHSFTDNWKAIPRPWHITVLWDQDPRLARPLLHALQQEDGLVVDENEPYKGALNGDSMYQHGTSRGLAHALLEIRQDLIRSTDGQQQWADRLALVLRALLERRDVVEKFRQVHYFGSATDDAQ